MKAGREGIYSCTSARFTEACCSLDCWGFNMNAVSEPDEVRPGPPTLAAFAGPAACADTCKILPPSYTASNTAITPLGEQEEFQLGTTLRNRYFDPSSSNHVDGLNETIVDASQVVMSADAGGEGGVIFDSAIALTQGLFPPTPLRNTTLANGTTVVSPLGGYQYIPLESVEVEEDYSLESWTECPAYTADNAAWYQSPAFKAKADESADFLASLKPITGDRSVGELFVCVSEYTPSR